MTIDEPIPIFIVTHERPLYLWASLDSLYRNTRHPHRVILADNNSRDPRVRRVVEGFQRRGMFHDVEFCDHNDPRRIWRMIQKHEHLIGEYLVYYESDVLVHTHEPCWLERLLRHMHANPSLGMLGSHIDSTDFVSPNTARLLCPDMSEADLAALAKLHSPERKLGPPVGHKVISPFNPPGRLLALRYEVSEHMEKTRIPRDSHMHRELIRAGYKTGIATDVVHRHLSLLNIYDHVDYNMRDRDQYFQT